MKPKVSILKVSLCVIAVCAGMCTYSTFPPGWRSDPGSPPVTLWMIAVTQTCLISVLMLGFWWPPHFDATARLNPAALCDTHTHSWPDITIRPCILTGGAFSFFPLSCWALIFVVFLTFCFHPIIPGKEGLGLQPEGLRNIIFNYLASFSVLLTYICLSLTRSKYSKVVALQ